MAKLKIMPFGQEDLSHINERTLVTAMERINPIGFLINMIHYNKTKPCNFNCISTGKTYDYVFTSSNKYELVVKDELSYKLQHSKLKYLLKLIKKSKIKKYKKSIEPLSIMLDQLKCCYLNFRTGIFQDDDEFDPDELKEYAKCKELNKLMYTTENNTVELLKFLIKEKNNINEILVVDKITNS
jgi:hypothetical protein